MTVGQALGSLVLRRARVRTMRPGSPVASALAIRDGRIAAVGTDQEVWSVVGAEGPTVDLGGRVVLPGFTDAHVHWCTYALQRRQLRLRPTMGLGEVQRAVRTACSDTPAGAWVVGRGWDHTRWGQWPTASDLDGVAPSHPVALTRIDGHVVWLNSAGLAAAGVGPGTPDPAGGEIVRRDGAPTGILKENALRLVTEAVPEPEPAERQAAMVDAWPDAWCRGITGCHDMGFRESALFRDLSTLRDSGELGLRFVWYFPESMLGEGIGLGLASGMGDEWLRFGGLKLFLDGTFGSQSASLLAPYASQPDNRGIATMTPDTFVTVVASAAGAGIATAVHAIGDAACRTALDGFAQVREQPSRSPGTLRHRIEHVQLIDPADVHRFAALAVVASMQPIHATSDMAVVDRWLGDRAANAYAWRGLSAAGARMAFGSDAPIESLDVFRGIHAAATRRSTEGDPPGGWYPEQCLSVQEALEAYTIGPAYAGGQEDSLGSLEVGKAADLIVLDRDPLTVDPMELPAVQVRATMIEGVWVWQAPDVEFGGPRHAS